MHDDGRLLHDADWGHVHQLVVCGAGAAVKKLSQGK
jgi:hypothetical protein